MEGSMALEPGSRLGHDDVAALLGEGGMGQVWQATDTQLNRQVALKILPDAFAADPDRMARFEAIVGPRRQRGISLQATIAPAQREVTLR